MTDRDDSVRENKNEERLGRSLDEPAFRRRSSSSRSSFKRRREEEYEDEVQSRENVEDSFQRQLRRRAIDRGGYQENYDDLDDIDYDDDVERAPLLVRLSAWVVVLIIFFTIGYVGANYFFKWTEKKSAGRRIERIVESGTEVAEIKKETPAERTVKKESANYVLFIPEGDKFKERATDIKKGLKEEDANTIISMYIDALKEADLLSNEVRLLSVFFSGDWAYVDLSPEFVASLKKLGKKDAPAVPNGMLKTVAENFPPVKKIKFYIDSKETKEKNPIDLSKPWESTK